MFFCLHYFGMCNMCFNTYVFKITKKVFKDTVCNYSSINNRIKKSLKMRPFNFYLNILFNIHLHSKDNLHLWDSRTIFLQ